MTRFPRLHSLAALVPAALISLTFLAFPAAAQLLPGSEQAEPEPATLPDLAALRTGWSDYFRADQPQAADRHAEFVAYAQEGLTRLSPERREEGERLVEMLRNNLAAYLELANRPALEPEPLPPSVDAYTFDQLLRIKDAARTAGRLVADDELEVSRSTRRADRDSAQRDRAFREYIAEADPEARWYKGLRLAEARIQLLLSNARLQLAKTDLANAAEFRRGLDDRLEYARVRLEVPAGKEDIAAAVDRVAGAQTALDEARAAFDEAALKAAGFDLSTEEGKAEQRVQQQRALRAETEFARARIALMQAEAELWLTRMYSDNRPGLSRLKEQKVEWQQIDREISSQRGDWQRDLEAELLLVQGTPRDGLSRKLGSLLSARLELGAGTLNVLKDIGESLDNFRFTTQVVDQVAATRVSRFKQWLGVGYESVLATQRWFGSVSRETLFSLGDTPITGDALLTVFLWLFFAVLLSKLVRKGLARIGAAGGTANSAGLYTFGRLFHYFIIVLAVFLALASIGVDFSSLALIAGALGVGIGFGLQNIVNNFVSGLVILFEGSLRVGDYIELDTGVTGTVKAIDARSTLINTNDNIDIIVPNGEIAANKLTNWTLGEYILRMRIPFGVEYGSDKELVKKAAIEAANEVHYTLQGVSGREPDVWLVEFGDSALNFLLLVWVNRQGARRPTRTRAAYLWALDNAFKKYGITVPFPQRDLHLKSDARGLSGPDDIDVLAPGDNT